MKTYRLSVIGDSGCVVDVYEPECDSDEMAYATACELVGKASIDIWQGDRWMGWLDGKDPQRISLAHHTAHRN